MIIIKKLMKKKKYKSVITKRIYKSLEKVGICFLILILFSPLVLMRGTNAGFLDEEKSEGNIFSSSTLDFYVSSGDDFSPKISPSMETIRLVSIDQEGMSDFNYRVSVDNISGGTDLCDELEIKDDLDDSYQSLSSYVSSSTDNLTKTDWNFTVQLADNDDALADKTCDFDLKFESWQENLAYGVGGFVDVENISSSIESEHWTNIADHLVINKVYYDVDGSHGLEGTNEWVEIYNPTSSAVNLKDWEICDGLSCDVIASVDLDIPANGYAVITNSATTWGVGWTVPGTAVKIALGSDIGSGLNNLGDRVILEDDNGTEIDRMSYGTDIIGLNPACPDVSEGHSLARKPAGQDLDINSDFEDLSSPNPGTNPHTVVMNEIMPNPFGDDDSSMPNGEWIELYNYGEYLIDLADWKLEDGDGDNLDITEDNTDTGSTVIAGGEKIVVYRNGDGDFNLSDEGDEVRLIDEKDLIKDSHEFEETPEGKTIARFPDAVGPWVDPEGTPGEENEMTEVEMEEQILVAYEKCFDKKNRLDDDEKYEPICQVEYLHYLGLLDELDDESVDMKLVNEILNKLEDDIIVNEEPDSAEAVTGKEDEAEKVVPVEVEDVPAVIEEDLDILNEEDILIELEDDEEIVEEDESENISEVIEGDEAEETEEEDEKIVEEGESEDIPEVIEGDDEEDVDLLEEDKVDEMEEEDEDDDKTEENNVEEDQEAIEKEESDSAEAVTGKEDDEIEEEIK